MNKILKGFLSLFRRPFFIKDVIGDYNEYDYLLNTSFVEPRLLSSIHRDIVLLVINNSFYVDFALLMTHFRRHYNFTVNEFMILAFKVGSYSKVYLENPVKLLEDAMDLTDDFTPKDMERLKVLLEQQKNIKARNFDDEHKDYLIKVEDDKRKAKLRVKGIENDKADEQIDAWLQNNKGK